MNDLEENAYMVLQVVDEEGAHFQPR